MQALFSYIDGLHYLTLAGLAGALILVMWIYDKVSIRYRHKAIYPYEIEVDRIDTPPPPDKLPKLSELRGIAPDITGGLSSEEYIRKMRDLDG